MREREDRKKEGERKSRGLREATQRAGGLAKEERKKKETER